MNFKSSDKGILLKYPNSKIEAIEIQTFWKEKYFKEKIERDTEDSINISQIKRVAGVDISYSKEKESSFGVACAVLWDLDLNSEAEHNFAAGNVDFPYFPGLLAFRESFLISKALSGLSLKPDLILCDGHGYAHPQRFGEATHLGYALDTPSIGVAKQIFIGKANWKKLSRFRGYRTMIVENKVILGYAIVLADNHKPVFISAGYRTFTEDVIALALISTISHTQPEPLFLADHYSRQELKIREKI